MDIDHTEIMWLDEHHEVSLNELIELSGLSMQELQQLVESGALTPTNSTADKHLTSKNLNLEALHFNSHCLVSIRTLSRLKHDFELEPNALALTLVFLERIRTLEFQLRGLNHIRIKGNTEDSGQR